MNTLPVATLGDGLLSQTESVSETVKRDYTTKRCTDGAHTSCLFMCFSSVRREMSCFQFSC